MILDQRDCFAAAYLQLHRQANSSAGDLKKVESRESIQDTSRMNLMEIMSKENELLRQKDKAWAKEVEKLRDSLRTCKQVLKDKEEKLQ